MLNNHDVIGKDDQNDAVFAPAIARSLGDSELGTNGLNDAAAPPTALMMAEEVPPKAQDRMFE